MVVTGWVRGGFHYKRKWGNFSEWRAVVNLDCFCSYMTRHLTKLTKLYTQMGKFYCVSNTPHWEQWFEEFVIILLLTFHLNRLSNVPFPLAL